MAHFCWKPHNDCIFERSHNPYNGLKALHSHPPPPHYLFALLLGHFHLVSTAPGIRPSCCFSDSPSTFIRQALLHLWFPLPGFSSPGYLHSSPLPTSGLYSNTRVSLTTVFKFCSPPPYVDSLPTLPASFFLLRT